MNRTVKHENKAIVGSTASWRIRAHVRPARLPLFILCCGLLSLFGFGPADYKINVYGNMYILRRGRNVFSLDRMVSPPNSGQASVMFEIVCNGIATYGNSNSLIYGTIADGGFYIYNPPGPISIFRERKPWEETLKGLGVYDLVVPAAFDGTY